MKIQEKNMFNLAIVRISEHDAKGRNQIDQYILVT